jgi:hypothetical protein
MDNPGQTLSWPKEKGQKEPQALEYRMNKEIPQVLLIRCWNINGKFAILFKKRSA